MTALENDELLSRDLFANELGLNSDRIATLRTNWDYFATPANRLRCFALLCDDSGTIM